MSELGVGDWGLGIGGRGEASSSNRAWAVSGRQLVGLFQASPPVRRSAWSRQLVGRTLLPPRLRARSEERGQGRAGVTAALRSPLTLNRHPERREGSGPERAGETASGRPSLYPSCHPEPREGSRCRRLKSWQSIATAAARVEIPGSSPGQALRLRAAPSAQDGKVGGALATSWRPLSPASDQILRVAQDDRVCGAMGASWRSLSPGSDTIRCATQNDVARQLSWRMRPATQNPSSALASSLTPVELAADCPPHSVS